MPRCQHEWVPLYAAAEGAAALTAWLDRHDRVFRCRKCGVPAFRQRSGRIVTYCPDMREDVLRRAEEWRQMVEAKRGDTA